MTIRRPGGELSSRPLHFFWLADCSASMAVDGKIQALNNAIREALPHMRKVGAENPNAKVFVRALRFSHGATWQSLTAEPLEAFTWNEMVADPPPAQRPQADIVFLLDTSGSMGDEIDGVKQSCADFAEHIIREGALVRLGLVGFDIGGHPGVPSGYKVHTLSTYTIGVWPLVEPARFKKHIACLSVGLFGGGGCYLANPDSVDIFPHVVGTFDSSAKNARVLVIISDEMGNTEGVRDIVAQLEKASITAHVLGVPRKNGAHEQIASRTGGKFWNITECGGVHDFTDLLGNVAKTIAKEVAQTLSDGTVSQGTDMGAALRLLSQELVIPPMSDRALPPVLVLVSDGQPTDDFNAELQHLLSLPWGKKAVRIAIAIGKDADLNCLQKFIGHEEIKPLKADTPEALVKYIKWASTVALKSASQSRIGTGSVPLTPPPDYSRRPEAIKGNAAAETVW